MKTKVLLNVFFLFSFLFSACTLTLKHEKIGTEVVQDGLKVVPASSEASGIQYALPNTGLRFYITAERLLKKRGDYYLYSERYLGVKDVILEDEEIWTIKGIRLETFGTASEDVFVVTSASTFMPLLNLYSDGVLGSINADVEPRIQLIEEPKFKKAAISFVPYTEEMLLANSTAKMAQEAAKYIYRLRENRTALLSSELDVLPPDGAAYVKSLSDLSTLESRFMSLFVGQEEKMCVTEVIEIVPERLLQKEVLFRFSTFAGVVDKDDLRGSPVYMTMNSTFEAEQLALPDTAGLFYRRPALINVTLQNGLDEVLKEQVQIGQLGSISALPISALSDEIGLQLYPATGAIKSLTKR